MVRQTDDQQESTGQRPRRGLRNELKGTLKALGLIARVVVAIAAVAKWLDH